MMVRGMLGNYDEAESEVVEAEREEEDQFFIVGLHHLLLSWEWREMRVVPVLRI